MNAKSAQFHHYNSPNFNVKSSRIYIKTKDFCKILRIEVVNLYIVLQRMLKVN